MAVVKDRMFISHHPFMISVFEGKSNDALITGQSHDSVKMHCFTA